MKVGNIKMHYLNIYKYNTVVTQTFLSFNVLGGNVFKMRHTFQHTIYYICACVTVQSFVEELTFLV